MSNTTTYHSVMTNETTFIVDKTYECQIALDISHQPDLIILTLVTVVSCAVGLTSAGLLSYYLYRKPVYHINIRMLMWNMCLALSMLVGGIGYLSLDHLWTFVANQQRPCEMVVSLSACHTQRSMALILPTFVVAYGALAMAVERGYATYNYRKYETKQWKLLGFSFIAVQWVVGIMPTLINYLKKERDDKNGTMPYCISLLITPTSATGGMVFSFVFEVASLAFVIVLLIVNSRRHNLKVGAELAKADGGHLSERYQLAENLNTTRMLIPSIAGQILVTLMAYADAIYVAGTGTLAPEDVADMAFYNELLSLLLSLYAPTFCVTCIVQSPQLFRHVRHEWSCLPSPRRFSATVDVEGRRGTAPTVDGIADTRTAHHFQQLDVLWSTNRKKPLEN